MRIKANNFNNKCYELLKLVPKGKITTYKEIAHALNTKAYRAVGNAMANNQHIIVIPCHRVVKSDGNIGQYAKGIEQKTRLLKSEGIPIKDNKIENFKKYLYKFN